MSRNQSESLSSAARQWLEARGLDPILCEERLGITSFAARDGFEWLTIPYMRGDVRANRKFRRLDQKQWRQDAGGEQIFWRLDCLSDTGLAEQPLVITEGEFDAIAAMQAGYWRTVSIPSGAPAMSSDEKDSRAAKYQFLEAAHALLEPIREIIISTDADGPGAAALSDLTARLGPARCKFVSYPAGCKDLNDVLREHGEEGVKAAIDGARWVRVAGVHKLSELPPLPPLTVWRPRIYSPIDELLPICPGHVSVWTGVPGHGKSSLLNAVAWTIADRYDIRIAHGAFESTPQREYLEDAIAFRTGRALDDREQTPEAVNAARDWVEEHIIFLISDGYAAPMEQELIEPTLDWFFRAAQTAVVRYGCRIVILDPWSQIEHARTNAEPETNYIQRSLRRSKAFARSFDVHVAIIAHPTKQTRLDDGRYKMPEGYDISGSAHWFNGVDLGVTIHRNPPLIDNPDGGEKIPDHGSPRVLVRTWKVKYHRTMGKPGDASAFFDFMNGHYGPPEPRAFRQ